MNKKMKNVHFNYTLTFKFRPKNHTISLNVFKQMFYYLCCIDNLITTRLQSQIMARMSALLINVFNTPAVHNAFMQNCK